MKKKLLITSLAAVGLLGVSVGFGTKNVHADEYYGKGGAINITKEYPGYHIKDILAGPITCNKGYTTKNSIVVKKGKTWKMSINAVSAVEYASTQYDGTVSLDEQLNLYGTFSNNSKHSLEAASTFLNDHFYVYQKQKNGKLKKLPTQYLPFTSVSEKKMAEDKFTMAKHSTNFMWGAIHTTEFYKGQKIVIKAYNNTQKRHKKLLASKTFTISEIKQENAKF